MPNITVNLPQDSYQIAISPDSVHELGNQMQQLKLGNKVLVISNPEIFGYYGEACLNSLQHAGFETYTHLIPAGEEYKHLESIQQVYDVAQANHLERASTFVALGGGVVGDMTGFAAATWLRGVNFVQVPTSLLAIVDASVGGKTGVNHPHGKNLIGAFYQPKLVAIDSNLLQTLPPREFRAGIAEVIKYGVIWDQDLFTKLEHHGNLNTLEQVGEQLLETIITRSCQAKAEVVSQDERESGIRAILNYGHTIGHAVESLTHYKQFVHGEAVAIGMVAAGKIAAEMGLWTREEAQRQDILIAKAGLPTAIPPEITTEAILETIKSDKKVKAGKVRFILPTEIGKVLISDRVTPEIITKALK
ncbi:MAG: 3-dehydroquinate synthase [Cyanobacteria bacterium P01_G01_bin.39]